MPSPLSVARRIVQPAVPRFMLEPWLQRRFFAARGWDNLHWGVFDSFADALAYARRFHAHTRFGADHEAVLRRHAVLKAHDYPVLFWLARAMAIGGGHRLVDLGGSVGASYYGYRDRLGLAEQWEWVVCELDEVIARGRAIAATRRAPHLRFTNDRSEIDGAAILFSAGCLQYLEQPLPEILRALAAPPPHVIINRLALTTGKAFITLQNTGYSISPCRVDNAPQFAADMAALGYLQEDSWTCLDNHTEVPFHPECTLAHFLGLYFRRVADGVPADVPADVSGVRAD